MSKLPIRTKLGAVTADYEVGKTLNSRVGIQWTIESIDAWLRHPLLGMGMDDEQIAEIDWPNYNGKLMPYTRWRTRYDPDTVDQAPHQPGAIAYGGWLINEDACIMQQCILEWASKDAGCTTIEVKYVDPKTQAITWEQEIG